MGINRRAAAEATKHLIFAAFGLLVLLVIVAIILVLAAVNVWLMLIFFCLIMLGGVWFLTYYAEQAKEKW